MAEHRPNEILLALIRQALAAAPQGLAPRQILDHLVRHGEYISRPTLNRLLALGVKDETWAPQSGGRSVVYTLGKSVPLPLIGYHFHAKQPSNRYSIRHRSLLK